MKSCLSHKNFFVVWVFLAVLSTSAKVANCETYGEGTGENTVPIACIVEGDRTIEAGGEWEVRVTLDGSCSSDADSAEGTNNDISDFEWYEVVDICDPNRDIFLGSGQIIECNLPSGAHVIVLNVTDGSGAIDSNEAVITVEDMLLPMTEPNAAVIACGGDSNNTEESTAGVVATGQGSPTNSGKVIGWGGQVVGVDLSGGFTSVESGWYHSFGLKADGSIVAWGYNTSGQCNVPLPNTGFIVVAGGHSHSLGLKTDGSIVAWGWNGYGQCNVPLPNTGFAAVAAGFGHSLGVKADGSIVAWGLNNFGQCSIPAPNTGFVAVAAGSYQSLGLKADGSIVAWGDNRYGQCDVPSPNTGFVAVAAGWRHSLGLKDDGSIRAWGYNYYGQCNVPTPNSGFVAMVAGRGGDHSLGLKEDGSIVAWGSNYSGQCNIPSPNSGFVAVEAGAIYSLGLKTDGSIVEWGSHYNVPLPNSGFVAVAAGYYHSLGLKADSSIVAWGSRPWYHTPTPNTGFIAIAAGGGHNLCLKADGSIVASGNVAGDDYGQLNVPAPNSNFVAVTGGVWHSLGLKQDGSIRAWGRNDDGQCDVPAPNTGFAAVAGGEQHSLGLKQDGSIVAWGDNLYGRCDVPSPNTDFVAVGAGRYHSLGLKQDGSIVAWGSNYSGLCNIPLPNSDYVAIAAGYFHSLGLKADGSVVAWGRNDEGQCNVPAPNNSGFVAVAGGAYHSLAVLVINVPPVACVMGGGRVVEAGEDCEARIVLDGSCSSDEDSTEGTNDDINDFDWYEVIDACEPNSDIYVGSGEVIECNLGLGEHVITLEVTDKAGESDSNEVVVTIKDTTPPEIVCPVDITVVARWPWGKVVTFTAAATDLCDSGVEAVCEPPSGSVFAPGTTEVVCTATDASGNSSSCSFNVTVIPAIAMAMHFTPEALNPGSEGHWMKAHFVLPEGYEIGDLDVNTPAVLHPLGIESEYINVYVDEGRGRPVVVEVGFERRSFCEAVGNFGPSEVTVSVRLNSGEYFYGTDTIRIISNNLQYLAVLASYWLEGDCGAPDWCSGVDLNQNTVVDFVDFALFDGCCIEVIKE